MFRPMHLSGSPTGQPKELKSNPKNNKLNNVNIRRDREGGRIRLHGWLAFEE